MEQCRREQFVEEEGDDRSPFPRWKKRKRRTDGWENNSPDVAAPAGAPSGGRVEESSLDSPESRRVESSRASP
ncbi:hypothetical protein DBV15_10096, partial [Temnothorax longispinosus]